MKLLMIPAACFAFLLGPDAKAAPERNVEFFDIGTKYHKYRDSYLKHNHHGGTTTFGDPAGAKYDAYYTCPAHCDHCWPHLSECRK